MARKKKSEAFKPSVEEKELLCPSCGSDEVGELRKTALKVSFLCGGCNLVFRQFLKQKAA